MTPIVDFLLARYADEEVWARLAPAGIVTRLRDQGERVAQRYGDPEPPEEGEGVSLADAMWWTTRDAADWITRHDPARVLAECEAKRRIVAIHQIGADPCDTVRFLASPYADHPDYDERWRP